jgi:hypothetical protein
MSTYTDQVLTSLTAFDTALAGFGARLRTRPSMDPALRADVIRLAEWANRASAAASQLRFACNIVVGSAVDIVDFQLRNQGEAAGLASALGGVAQLLERTPAIRDALEDAVVAVDEAALDVAAALFPGAVDGLGEVNVVLWDFDRVAWREFTTKFRDAVRDAGLSFDQQARVQALASEVHQAFDDVNALLNALTGNDIAGAPAIRGALAAARAALLEAVDGAAAALAGDAAYAAFSPFAARASKLARKVDRLLDRLRIPVFPVHADLGALAPCIGAAAYDRLGGAQRFALLNIAARLQAVTLDGRTPLDPAYGVRVTRVFLDRIHLDADARLVDDIAADTGGFVRAPAGLRRYRDGAFRGRHGRTGNLHVSFRRHAEGGRVEVEVDLDRYRDPFTRLFGEVLVNHLTGRTSDQFEVQQILVRQKVQPIGGFGLLAA